MTKVLDNQDHVVAAVYRFVRLDDYADLREPLLQHCDEVGVKGTLLLAHEGINGTIAGLERALIPLLSGYATILGSQI